MKMKSQLLGGLFTQMNSNPFQKKNKKEGDGSDGSGLDDDADGAAAPTPPPTPEVSDSDSPPFSGDVSSDRKGDVANDAFEKNTQNILAKWFPGKEENCSSQGCENGTIPPIKNSPSDDKQISAVEAVSNEMPLDGSKMLDESSIARNGNTRPRSNSNGSLSISQMALLGCDDGGSKKIWDEEKSFSSEHTQGVLHFVRPAFFFRFLHAKSMKNLTIQGNGTYVIRCNVNGGLDVVYESIDIVLNFFPSKHIVSFEIHPINTSLVAVLCSDDTVKILSLDFAGKKISEGNATIYSLKTSGATSICWFPSLEPYRFVVFYRGNIVNGFEISSLGYKPNSKATETQDDDDLLFEKVFSLNVLGKFKSMSFMDEVDGKRLIVVTNKGAMISDAIFPLSSWYGIDPVQKWGKMTLKNESLLAVLCTGERRIVCVSLQPAINPEYTKLSYWDVDYSTSSCNLKDSIVLSGICSSFRIVNVGERVHIAGVGWDSQFMFTVLVEQDKFEHPVKHIPNIVDVHLGENTLKFGNSTTADDHGFVYAMTNSSGYFRLEMSKKVAKTLLNPPKQIKPKLELPTITAPKPKPKLSTSNLWSQQFLECVQSAPPIVSETAPLKATLGLKTALRSDQTSVGEFKDGFDELGRKFSSVIKERNANENRNMKKLLQTVHSSLERLSKEAQDSVRSVFDDPDAVQAFVRNAMNSVVENESLKQQALLANIKPHINEAFLNAFQTNLLPAFEAGIQEVVSQIGVISSNSVQSRGSPKDKTELKELRKAIEKLNTKVNEMDTSLSQLNVSSREPCRVHPSIHQLISLGEYDDVLCQALSSNDIGVVVATIKMLDVDLVFPDVNCAIPESTLLFLMQQLSDNLLMNLESEGMLKMLFIKRASFCLRMDQDYSTRSREVLHMVLHNLNSASTHIGKGTCYFDTYAQIKVRICELINVYPGNA